MSDPIISAENLGKRYLVGHQSEREKYTALRDVITRNIKGLIRTTRDLIAGKQVVQGDEIEEFWALKNVDFEVNPGDVLGIVGRNGAGKSTLLKILSRITEPTEGRVIINGRVASLLEVGTGFHPELSGRENIYLNGAILGMTRAEIRRKFDEIVEFAEVTKFLDTPVKRYSSGMYVRLAFAVAAHLEPDILIVDEVLAVGDAGFQKKCLGKMQDVSSREGRTVLFVSHNMEAVDTLTSKCLWLEGGKTHETGPTSDVLRNYMATASDRSANLSSFRVSSLSKVAGFIDVWTENIDSEKTSTFRQGEPFRIAVRLCTSSAPVDVAIVVENALQHALFTTHLTDKSDPLREKGLCSLIAEMDYPKLRSGNYLVSLAIFSPDRHAFHDVIHHFPLFQIAGSLDPTFPDDVRWGEMFFPIKWTKRQED